MKTIINDTCDVIMTRISDSKIVFIGESQLASFSQKVKEDKIYGSIGNKVVAILSSEKTVDLKVRNAVFDSDYLEIVLGNSFKAKTGLIFKKEENLTLDATKLFVTIAGTPKTGGIMKLIAPNGNSKTATFATTKLTAESAFAATDGLTGYTALYQVEAADANTLSIDSAVFSEKYKVEYHTIEYNVLTNAIVNDLYFQFDSVLPSGNFDLSFENGKPQTPELDLMALCPLGSSEIGRIIEIPRTIETPIA